MNESTDNDSTEKSSPSNVGQNADQETELQDDSASENAEPKNVSPQNDSVSESENVKSQNVTPEKESVLASQNVESPKDSVSESENVESENKSVSDVNSKSESEPMDEKVETVNRSFHSTKRPATESTSEASPVPLQCAKVHSRVIFMCNVPVIWAEGTIKKFIKANSRSPEAYKGLLYMYRETDENDTFNGNCHLLYKDEATCKVAFYCLRTANRVVNKTKIMIEFEYPTSPFAIPWLNNSTPDFEAIKKRKEQNKSKQEENRSAAKPHNVMPEQRLNESTDNDSSSSSSPSNIGQNADQETELQNGSASENVESENKSVSDMNSKSESELMDESIETVNINIKKEPGLEHTTIPDNKSSQNAPVVQTKTENNTATNKTTEENKNEHIFNSNTFLQICKKVLLIMNMSKTTLIEDVYTLIKENTNDEIYQHIDDVNMIKNKKARAYVSFKTEEHAALAKSLLEVMANAPFEYVKFYSVYSLKRPATESTSEACPVPLKHARVDSRVLFLCNIPVKWTQEALTNFIKVNLRANPKVYKGLLYMYRETDENDTFNGNCHLLYKDEFTCKQAIYHLRRANRVFNKTKILIELEKPSSSFAIPWLINNTPDFEAIEKRKLQNKSKQQAVENTSAAQPHYVMPNQSWTLEQKFDAGDVSTHFIKQNIDPNDTYGLTLQYLNSLGITPPLSTKVWVSNLSMNYGDEGMITRLFSHAGVVKEVNITNRTNDHVIANVEFDHPLEAVQAISMFNCQDIFMKRIIVAMDQSPHAFKTSYPPGVYAFGRGLCSDGSALKNVRNSIEIQKAVNMLLSKIDDLNNTIKSFDRTLQEQSAKKEDSSANAVQTSLASMASTLTNAQTSPLLALSALLNPQAAQVLQLLQQPQAAGVLNPALTQLPGVAPQAQSSWNAGVPAGQPPQPADTNMQGTPITQPVANMQPGPYVQGAPQVQAAPRPGLLNTTSGQYGQTVPNAPPVQYAHGPNVPPAQYAQNVPAAVGQNAPAGTYAQTGQFTQTGHNMPAAQYNQGAPNAQYAQGGQNMPVGHFPQSAPTPTTGQNIPTGQYPQSVPCTTGQNMPAEQFAQGGPNMTKYNAQYAQGGQNMPVGHFPQSAPTPTTGQNMRAEQFAQGGPNLTGQYWQGGPNAAPSQFAQGTNVTAQYQQSGPNVPSAPYHGANAPVGQYGPGGPTQPGQLAQRGPTQPGQLAQSGPSSGPNVPAGQFNRGGPNTGIGPNLPFGQQDHVTNAPVGQYGPGGPTQPGQLAQRGPTQPGQLAQSGPSSGPNVPAGQFNRGGPNTGIGPNLPFGQQDHVTNAPVGQYGPGGPAQPGQLAQRGPTQPGQLAQSGPSSGPNVPAGQFNRGGLNTGIGQNLPFGQQDRGRSTSSERNNKKITNSQSSPDDPWSKDPSCTVMFSYLPPSVTLSALKSKMAEVGKVRAADMIGAGRARVAFHSSADAAECIQLLDHTKVDGQTIEVKYY